MEFEKCPSPSWDRLWKVSPGKRALVLEGALSTFTSDDSSFPWQRPFLVLHSENLLWFLAVTLVGGALRPWCLGVSHSHASPHSAPSHLVKATIYVFLPVDGSRCCFSRRVGLGCDSGLSSLSRFRGYGVISDFSSLMYPRKSHRFSIFSAFSCC